MIKATIYFQKKFKKSLDTGEIPCYTLISYAVRTFGYRASFSMKPQKNFTPNLKKRHPNIKVTVSVNEISPYARYGR